MRFQLAFCFILICMLFPQSGIYAENASEAWTAIRLEMQAMNNRVARSAGNDKEAFKQLTNTLKQFIRAYPDAPEVAEAYYLLGEGYLNAGFESEGLANLQIAAQKFPESPWAEEALLAMLRYMEKTGDRSKNEAFYKDLIKKHPQSKAAQIARIASAMERLAKGQKAKVVVEMENMEKDNPNLFLDVPMALDLKAHILAMEGKEEEARALWMQYLNLSSSQSAKTQTIFNIAESFFREKQWVQAKKYYGLLVTSHPNARELAWAQFRLLEIDEITNTELSGIGAKTKEIKPEKKEEIVQAVVNGNAPLHLTQEAYLKLLRMRLKDGQFLEFLKGAEEFEKRWPKSPYMNDLVELIKTSETEMLAKDIPNKDALDIISLGQAYLSTHTKSHLLPSFLWITQEIWLKLVQNSLHNQDYETAITNASELVLFAKDPETKEKATALEWEARVGQVTFLLKNQDYDAAISKASELLDIANVPERQRTANELAQEARLAQILALMQKQAYEGVALKAAEMVKSFPETEKGRKALEIGRTALGDYFKAALDKDDAIIALNFYYNHKDELSSMLTPNSLFQIGRLWSNLACPIAAQRAFFQAWLKNDRQLWPELFMEWTNIAIAQHEAQEAEALLNIFERQHPKGLDSRYWILKAKAAKLMEKWEDVSNAAQKALSLQAKDVQEAKLLWFDAALHLRNWAEAHAVWLGMEQGLGPELKGALLKRWGDGAMLAGAYMEALFPYNELQKLQPDDPAILARNGLLYHIIGDEREATRYLETARKDSGIWGKMAATILDTQAFLQGTVAQ